MPILVAALLIGVLAYFIWRRATTTLTRNCRWRLNRPEECWRCAFCGAQSDGLTEPKKCARR